MWCVVYVLFFFVKQKPAYEMRISDWSSDVCSSDLRRIARQRCARSSPSRGLAMHLLFSNPQVLRLFIAQALFWSCSMTGIIFTSIVGLRLAPAAGLDPQSVVLGKSVSVRVGPGVRRLHKKKNTS